MSLAEVQEFTSEGQRYEVRIASHDDGYRVQVFADERPIGPSYSVTFGPAARPDAPRRTRADDAAAEVVVDVAKRWFGWRGAR